MRQGDPESIARLYSCYAARVYSICRRYTSNAELSRDLTHDIIIKALDKISGFKGGEVGALNSWLSRITVNETVTYLRRHRKHIFVDCQALGDIPADDSDEERILSLPEDVISGSDSYTFVGRYLGIPLSLNLIGTNRNALSYYASAGIRMDKCIGGEYGLTEVSEKGLQYTLTGGVGLDIPVSDKLSLTFEPQVGYRLTDISIPGASHAGRLDLSANIGLCFRVGKIWDP